MARTQNNYFHLAIVNNNSPISILLSVIPWASYVDLTQFLGLRPADCNSSFWLFSVALGENCYFLLGNSSGWLWTWPEHRQACFPWDTVRLSCSYVQLICLGKAQKCSIHIRLKRYYQGALSYWDGRQLEAFTIIHLLGFHSSFWGKASVIFSRHNKLVTGRCFGFPSKKHRALYVLDLDFNPVQLVFNQVFQITITHTFLKQTNVSYISTVRCVIGAIM